MTERDIEILKVVNETGNITNAADKLCTTQSALSKRIKLIEDELNAQIFKRSRGGAILTKKGEIVLKYCYNFADKMVEMRQALNSASEGIEGKLSVGMSIDQTRSYIADLLCEYRSLYPNVQQNIRTGKSQQLYNMFIDNNIDIALIRGDFPWSGYKSLVYSEHVCMVSSGKDIQKNSCISYLTDDYMNMMISRWMQENGYELDTNAISADSITVCMELVKKGIGWCIMPEIYLKDYDGEITYCYYKDGTPIMRNTYLYAHPNKMKQPQIKAFIDLIHIYGYRA